MIKVRYNDFIVEKLTQDILSYYIFDWDDNILYMDTKIHLDKLVNGKWVPVDVSTSEFRDIRKYLEKWSKGEESDWRFRNGEIGETYNEFRDYGPRGKNAFLDDSIKSIKKSKFGPSWDNFIDCLTKGSMFLIATARGHEPESIRKTVEWIIFNVLDKEQLETMVDNLKSFNDEFEIELESDDITHLVDKYLDNCDFIGISSQFFKDFYNNTGNSMTPEQGKKISIKRFVRKINYYGKILGKKVSVGFSDDDFSTVKSVKSFIKNELSLSFPLDYNLYHTKNYLKKIQI